MYRLLLLAAVVLSMFLVACSDDNPTDPGNDSENSFTVNGNGYNNQKVPIMTDDIFSFAGEEDDGQSVAGTVIMQGIVNEDLYIVSIVIDDVGKGTFQVSQTEGVGVSLNVIKEENQTQPEIYFSNGGTVTIDEWGGVGGTARGSFEATAVITPSMDQQVSIKGNFELSPIRE